MLLFFPSLNEFSLPLIVLVGIGYICAALLFIRYTKEKQIANLFLALLLIVTGFHRSSDIIGFMGWYDTFRNTKVNYFLMNLGLSLGPLLYFYVRALTQARFKFSKADWWHFVPVFTFMVYRFIIWVYDVNQEGYELVQNGAWMSQVHMKYVQHFLNIFSAFSQVVYYAFAIQSYLLYRKRIKRYFSNTQKFELDWIRNFLILYTALFLFLVCLEIYTNFIESLHWQQMWWGHLAGAFVMLYVGINAYLINIQQFHDETAEVKTEEELFEEEEESTEEIILWKQKIIDVMTQEKPYLDPDLSLSQLAQSLQIGTSHLSQVINTGFGRNFKDFINEYRVEAVKHYLQEGDKKHLTLLGIALESGFNSKATFNRTFKKFTHQTPSEFIASQNLV